MADRYAVATGNWSDTATWDGGTLPGAGDVVRPNGYTITIDQNITVAEIRNDASSPAVAGGGFLITSGGISVTCDLIFAWSSLNFISISHSTGLVSIASSLKNQNNGAPCRCLYITGSGDIDISGDILQAVWYTTLNATVYYNSSGSCSFTGNIQAGYSGSISPTGNVEGAFAAFQGSVTINGTIFGSSANSGYGLFVFGGSVTVVGSIIGGSTNNTVNCSAAGACCIGGTLTVVGSCQASSSQPAVTVDRVISATRSINSGTVIINGVLENNANGISASQHPKTYIDPTSPITAIMQIASGTSNQERRGLYTGGQNLGQPTVNHVRSGHTFGVSNEYTGTLAVPDPAYVSTGVATDNTVGTLSHLTLADLQSALQPNAPIIVERSIDDEKDITFSWPVSGATITVEKSVDNGAYSATAGSVSYLRQEGTRYYYVLAYNANDRLTEECVVRYKLTDGTNTKYFNLQINGISPLSLDATSKSASLIPALL